MADTEVVYLARGNVIDIQLRADGEPVDLSGITSITASFGTKKVEGTGGASDPVIAWADTEPPPADWVKGEVRLDLGDQSIAAGLYKVPIIVRDAVYTTGLDWIGDPADSLRVLVVDDREAGS